MGGESYTFKRSAWVGGLWCSLVVAFFKLALISFDARDSIFGWTWLALGAVCLLYALWQWLVPYIRIADEKLVLNLGPCWNRVVRLAEINRYELGKRKVFLHKDMRERVKIDMFMLKRTDREKLMDFLMTRFG